MPHCRVGLTPGDVVEAVQIGLAGQAVSEIWIGQRRFDLTVKLSPDAPPSKAPRQP